MQPHQPRLRMTEAGCGHTCDQFIDKDIMEGPNEAHTQGALATAMVENQNLAPERDRAVAPVQGTDNERDSTFTTLTGCWLRWSGTGQR
jgi:hypothetical protein